MKIKKGQLLELEISGIAFGGKGIAKINGLIVFVEKAVPMDHVVARIVKKKKQYAEAFIDTLIKPSPFRVTPKCMYSGFCGGCKWQFLNYDKQLEYKQQHVVESIERIGQIHGVPVYPTIPSPEIFEYRNKMEFSCADRRWLLPDEMDKSNIDKSFALGLHVPGTFYKVIDTRVCFLQPELGNRILDDVRKFIRASGVPVYGLRSHIGFWRFLMLRHSATYDQWMVNVITSTEDRGTCPSGDLRRLQRRWQPGPGGRAPWTSSASCPGSPGLGTGGRGPRPPLPGPSRHRPWAGACRHPRTIGRRLPSGRGATTACAR